MTEADTVRVDGEHEETAVIDAVAIRDVTKRFGSGDSEVVAVDDIDLSISADRRLPEIEIDRSRFEQILTNLIENAAHALRGHEEPQIELRATLANKPVPTRRRADRSGSSYVHRREPDAIAFEVIDNGPGIPTEDLPRIFDPFFTTKDPGEGTGLGLWNAHRMAELLGGSLEAASRSGETCFRLIVPQADSPDEDGRPQGTDR